MITGVSPARAGQVLDTPVRIRQACFEDYDGIAILQERNGLTAKPRDEWEGLWKTNPAYRRAGTDWPLGWVIETDCGEIVGSISNIPKDYRFRGRNLRAAVISGWAVDSPYRAYSMPIFRRVLTQRNADLWLSTTASPAAESVLRLFKWSPAPVGAWNRSAFWITDYPGFLNAALNSRSVLLSRILSYPLAAGLFCADRLRNVGWPAGDRNCRIESCSGFDERFNRFWSELESRRQNTLLAVRSRESLAWQFRSALRQGNVWILAAYVGPRMIGYAILDRLDNEGLGLKRIRLVDFAAIEGCQEALGSALRWALERCRREAIHTLEVVGCWLDRPGGPRIRAPHGRSLQSCLYYYKAGNSGLARELLEESVWFPSSLDGDASL